MSGKLEPEKPEQSRAKTVWSCSLCPETFRWRRHMDKHLEGHRNNACRLCDATITTQKELALHMLQEHQVSLRNDKHACEHCERRFPRRRALYSHYQSSHSNGKIVCLDCGTFFNSEQELEQHAGSHSKDRPWKCHLCQASFSRRQQFTLHVEAHDQYCCKVCGRNFATKLALTEHSRDFHGVPTATHKCPNCEACFERPCQLRRHQESHKGSDSSAQRGGECCGRKFPSSRSLKKHQASIRHLEFITPDDRKKYECSKCSKRFARKSSMARHVAPPRIHTCDTCDFTSRNAGSARRHRLLHSAQRGFVCDRCAAAFFSLAALNEHAAYRHSDRRQFVCAACGLGFKTNSALTRHAQAHSDSRPHVCTCGQRYKRASHLRRHQTAAHGPTAPPSVSRKIARTTKPDAPTTSANPHPAPTIATETGVVQRGLPSADEATPCWAASRIGELGDRHLPPNVSLQVHHEIVSLTEPHPDLSHQDVGISCQTLLHQTMAPSHHHINVVHHSIGASYKDMVHQTVGDRHQSVHREMQAPVKSMATHGRVMEMSHMDLQHNGMDESHNGMVDQAIEMAHQDLLQQAMEMAHRDMIRQGLEVPRQGLGTPEQMLQDGYDFGATGLEFTTLQTVHKARDLTQITEEDMAFSADTFLL